MKNPKKQTLEDAIIDLYLNVKVRRQEDLEKYDKLSKEKEVEKLKQVNPFTIIEYIKRSIEILIDIKVQDKIQERKLNESIDEDEKNEYEKLLRKLECDIRNFIKIENQIKIHMDNIEDKCSELEKQNEILKSKNKILTDQLQKTYGKNNNEDLNHYKNEIEHMRKIIKTYEDHNLKIPELEKKIKIMKNNHEKEINRLNQINNDKINELIKKIEINKEKHKISNYPSNEDEINTQSESFRNRTNSADINYKSNRSKSNDKQNSILTNKENSEIINKINIYKRNINKRIDHNIKSTSQIAKSILLNNTIDTNKDNSELDHSKSHRKNDSVGKFENITKSLISKYENRPPSVDKNKPPININKNIYNMKEMNKSSRNEKSVNHNASIVSNSSKCGNNSNIILNQNGIPCYNNINIYTANVNGKPDINLRQYVFNKGVKKIRVNTKSHGRSNSINCNK